MALRPPRGLSLPARVGPAAILWQWATQQDLREFIFSKTDDPAIRARTNMIAEWALKAAPEVRAKERLEAVRIDLRHVLAVRRLALSAVDQAQIDGSRHAPALA